MMKEPETPKETAPSSDQAAPESASVVVAAFENSHAAERTVASLGHKVHHKHARATSLHSW
jgi:hypothetical protein